MSKELRRIFTTLCGIIVQHIDEGGEVDHLEYTIGKLGGCISFRQNTESSDSISVPYNYEAVLLEDRIEVRAYTDMPDGRIFHTIASMEDLVLAQNTFPYELNDLLVRTNEYNASTSNNENISKV